MNILYGIQGTGHGHISRAREILPLLSEKSHVDVLLSGYNCKMTVEGIQITKKKGVSLAYDSSGSVSYLKTALNLKPVEFLQDVNSLELDKYDLVISDYEPITAWASFKCKIPSIALSHQAAFLSNKSPRPKKRNFFAEQVLKHFAPCNTPIGFHFRRYDSFVLPPIIRKDVRDLSVSVSDHVTVYLPAFDHETLTSVFGHLKEVKWHVFSPLCDTPYLKDNVHVFPVGNRPFLESMKESIGVITSAGFETCAETMYLDKKLLVIPIQNQYEQECNAAALKQLGIHVVNKLDSTFKDRVRNWLINADIIPLPELADTDILTDSLVDAAYAKAYDVAY